MRNRAIEYLLEKVKEASIADIQITIMEKNFEMFMLGAKYQLSLNELHDVLLPFSKKTGEYTSQFAAQVPKEPARTERIETTLLDEKRFYENKIPAKVHGKNEEFSVEEGDFSWQYGYFAHNDIKEGMKVWSKDIIVTFHNKKKIVSFLENLLSPELDEDIDKIEHAGLVFDFVDGKVLKDDKKLLVFRVNNYKGLILKRLLTHLDKPFTYEAIATFINTPTKAHSLDAKKAVQQEASKINKALGFDLLVNNGAGYYIKAANE